MSVTTTSNEVSSSATASGHSLGMSASRTSVPNIAMWSDDNWPCSLGSCWPQRFITKRWAESRAPQLAFLMLVPCATSTSACAASRMVKTW